VDISLAKFSVVIQYPLHLLEHISLARPVKFRQSWRWSFFLILASFLWLFGHLLSFIPRCEVLVSRWSSIVPCVSYFFLPSESFVVFRQNSMRCCSMRVTASSFSFLHILHHKISNNNDLIHAQRLRSIWRSWVTSFYKLIEMFLSQSTEGPKTPCLPSQEHVVVNVHKMPPHYY